MKGGDKMNIAQLFFSTNQSKSTNIHNVISDHEQISSFEQMLHRMFFHKDTDVLDQFQSLGLLKKSTNHEYTSDLVSFLLSSYNDLQLSLDDDLTGEFQSTQQSNLGNIETKDDPQIDNDLPDLTEAELVEQQIDQMLISLPEHIQIEIKTLASEIRDVFSKLVTDDDLMEQSTRLLNLLERWTGLSKVLSKVYRTEIQPIELQDDQLQSVWEKLVRAYERRTSFSQTGQYNNESKVDQKTVAKWLQNALEDRLLTDSPKVQQQSLTQLNQSAPMSRMEQYVIYIQQNDEPHSSLVGKQLIDKFSKAIQTSRFLSMNNGVNQMMFHLKPDNLGEMTVRLVEINGEMTAKIAVTSETTRKLLQSNIHQLKNMFSPHQVVIERQDELSTQQIQDEQEHLHDQKENDHNPLHDEEQQDQNQDYEEDDESFQTILNEKV